jgi:hypothetical protein
MDTLSLIGITHAASLDLADGLITIGRNPTNDFRVPDPTVSSFHCELVVSGQTVLVRDLSSTNGTFIENQPVQEAFLKPWQILRLGQAELRLEVTESADATVRIPTAEAPTPASQLLDGRAACQNHPGVEAVLRCVKCGATYCADCVKPIGLKGGERRLFCPACSQPCRPLVEKPPPKKRGLIGRLTQTIRIRLGQQ